jgi:hypothetical protein
MAIGYQRRLNEKRLHDHIGQGPCFQKLLQGLVEKATVGPDRANPRSLGLERQRLLEELHHAPGCARVAAAQPAVQDENCLRQHRPSVWGESIPGARPVSSSCATGAGFIAPQVIELRSRDRSGAVMPALRRWYQSTVPPVAGESDSSMSATRWCCQDWSCIESHRSSR